MPEKYVDVICEIYYMLLFIIVRKYGYWQLSVPFLHLLVEFLQISIEEDD